MKEGKAIEVHEYEAIRNTLKYYVNGAFEGKSDIMKNAFHELAQIYGQLGDQQFAITTKGFSYISNPFIYDRLL